MSIELPGYKVMVENEVFLKDTFTTTKNKIKLKNFMVLGKFSLQSKEDVINYLQIKANKFENKDFSNKSQLEEILINIPQEARKLLVKGDSKTIKFIENFIDAPSIKELDCSSEYVDVMYGPVPELLIKNKKNKDLIKDASWYKQGFLALITSGFDVGEIFRANISLDNENLFNKNEIDFLLKHGVCASKTLDIHTPNNFVNYASIKEVINTIYLGLSKPEKILELKDESNDLLEYLAMQSIMRLYDMYKPDANKVPGSIKNVDEISSFIKDAQHKESLD